VPQTAYHGHLKISPSGAPLSSARVRFVAADQTVLLDTQTDDEGAYAGEGPAAADVRMQVWHAKGFIAIDYDGNGDHTLSLHPPRLPLAGSLLLTNEDGTDSPLVGAAVTILDTNPDESDDIILEAETDAEGRFAGLSAPWLTVEQHETWDPIDAVWRYEARPDGRTDDILDLSIQVSFEGRTYTRPFPWVGAALTIRLPTPEVPPEPVAERDIPPPQPPPEARDHTLKLVGRVTRQGAPVSGAAVRIVDIDPDGTRNVILEAETDAEGGFSGTSAPWKEALDPALSGGDGDGLDDILLDGDMLTLEAEIQVGDEVATLPFGFVADGVAVQLTLP